MAKLETNWQEYFYNEKYNPAIPLIKKTCHWIYLNVPDLSFLMGWKRKASGIGFFAIILLVSGLVYQIGGFSITIEKFLLKIAIVTVIALLLYMRAIAYMTLIYIEAYQKKAKKVLNRS